jgi:tetratricopeptide (TPR) repeat protein
MAETNPIELYTSFKETGQQSFRSIVDFWDEHYNDLYKLPLDKYFDLLNTYARALFELGKYKKYLSKAEEILSLSFEYNLTHWEDKDVVIHILLKKAAAHFHLYELQDAKKSILQVLALSPNHSAARHLLQRCVHRESRSKKQIWRAITILLLLAAALSVAAELIIIRPFFPAAIELTEFVRIGLFVAGLCLWAGAETIQWLRERKKCAQIIEDLSSENQD